MWALVFFLWAGILFLVGFASFCFYGISHTVTIVCFIFAIFFVIASLFLHVLTTLSHLFDIKDDIEKLTRVIIDLAEMLQKLKLEVPKSVQEENNTQSRLKSQKTDN